MDDEFCTADWPDANVLCDLPAGHEGDHHGELTWPQSSYDPANLRPETSSGYPAYLAGKHAQAAKMSRA